MPVDKGLESALAPFGVTPPSDAATRTEAELRKTVDRAPLSRANSNWLLVSAVLVAAATTLIEVLAVHDTSSGPLIAMIVSDTLLLLVVAYAIYNHFRVGPGKLQIVSALPDFVRAITPEDPQRIYGESGVLSIPSALTPSRLQLLVEARDTLDYLGDTENADLLTQALNRATVAPIFEPAAAASRPPAPRKQASRKEPQTGDTGTGSTGTV